MSVLSSRPRLELAHDGTGRVPRPHPEPANARPLTPLAERIHAARLEAVAARRRRPDLSLVGHNELTAINADLEAVRALNARLSHAHRSAGLAAWPCPVFRPGRLHSWCDLFDALDLAARVLGAAEARAQSWFARHV